MKLRLTVALISCFCFARAQDTILIVNNYTYKVGIKAISEQSSDRNYVNESYQVFSGGIQVIRRLGKTKSSIESGLYIITKAAEYNFYQQIIYYTLYPISIRYENLSIPLNYRIDTKLVYFSGGVFIDYLTWKTVTNSAYIDSIGYGIDRKLNWGINLATGLEKAFSKQFSLFVEGRLYYTMSSSKIDLDRRREATPGFINYGFAIGVNYKISKGN